MQFFHFSHSIWAKSTVRMLPGYNFGDWGWQIIGENLELTWLTIPPVSKSCSELVKCGCKTSYRGHRKCKNLDLCVQNRVLAMEIVNMLHIWLADKEFSKFLGQCLTTNMLFSLFLASCCIVHLRIMFK